MLTDRHEDHDGLRQDHDKRPNQSSFECLREREFFQLFEGPVLIITRFFS